MVRTVADRAFLPAKSLFEQVGDMMILTAKTIVSALRPPYPYGGEFIGQFLFARFAIPQRALRFSARSTMPRRRSGASRSKRCFPLKLSQMPRRS